MWLPIGEVSDVLDLSCFVVVFVGRYRSSVAGAFETHDSILWWYISGAFDSLYAPQGARDLVFMKVSLELASLPVVTSLLGK